jgi:hypothetical protein
MNNIRNNTGRSASDGLVNSSQVANFFDEETYLAFGADIARQSKMTDSVAVQAFSEYFAEAMQAVEEGVYGTSYADFPVQVAFSTTYAIHRLRNLHDFAQCIDFATSAANDRLNEVAVAHQGAQINYADINALQFGADTIAAGTVDEIVTIQDQQLAEQLTIR